MAKYDVTYSCGHAGVVELFGKEKDRQNKIQWYESDGLCPECYKKKMLERQSQIPLTLNAAFDLMVDDKILLYFSGNTMPVKEEIKELGYRWSNLHIGFKGLFSIKTEMGWLKYVSINNMSNEIDKVYKAFPEVKANINVSQMDLIYLQQKEETKDKNRQDYEKEVSELTKPVKPDCCPNEHWNGKVYGSKKNGYKIYINNNAVDISSEEKEQLEKYTSECAEYNDKVKEIKKKYKMI